MKMRIAAFPLLALIIAGCSQSSLNSPSDSKADSAQPMPIASLASLSKHDTDASWDSSATLIQLNGLSVSVNGQGAEAKGSTATITAKGTYVISGSLENGQIAITAPKTDKVHIVLNGASITNKTGAAIYASSCDKLIITLADGTKNTLEDGGVTFVYSDLENEEPNAALFSKDDLTFNGNGLLTVKAGFNNGIGTKDDLLIVSGSFEIEAANYAIRGNDSVTVMSGAFKIASGDDGIKAGSANGEGPGNILIESGDFAISSGGGYPGKSIQENKKHAGTKKAGGAAIASDPIPVKTGMGKAINAEGPIVINNGSFDISAYDDGIHSDIEISVNGGSIKLEAGATGIQAKDVTVTGGKITILNSYEGIEGENSLKVSNGDLSINASDDGISISSSKGCFTMEGGNIIITAGADGIDSNGSIMQSGGKVVITVPNMNGGGDGPIDYDGTFTRTGGTMTDINGKALSTEKLQMGGGRGKKPARP